MGFLIIENNRLRRPGPGRARTGNGNGNSHTRMEVEGHAAAGDQQAGAGPGADGGTLKRCSSAPMIAAPAGPRPHGHPLPQAQSREPDTHHHHHHQQQQQPLVARESSSFNLFSHNNQQRTRRFSASFSPHAHSPNGHGPRLTPRVSQLRQEESVDFTNGREAAHERETHNAMQMSQSWEDLTLMCGGGGGSNNSSGPASPTRMARLSPGVSPSPTRKAFATRRSLSPIAMRPSCLSPVGRPSGLIGMKRRFDLDEMPAAKRCCWSSDRLTPSTPGTPDSLGDPVSGFTFRPVSPRASPLPSPMSSDQNHPPQNPS